MSQYSHFGTQSKNEPHESECEFPSLSWEVLAIIALKTNKQKQNKTNKQTKTHLFFHLFTFSFWDSYSAFLFLLMLSHYSHRLSSVFSIIFLFCLSELFQITDLVHNFCCLLSQVCYWCFLLNYSISYCMLALQEFSLWFSWIVCISLFKFSFLTALFS